MIKCWTIALLLVLLGYSTVLSETSLSDLDIYETIYENKELINGYIWQGLTETQKRMYLRGYTDGVTASQIYHPVEESSNIPFKDPAHLITNLSTDELIKQIDEFYSQDENFVIPIPYVLLTLKNRLAGLDENTIEEYIKYLRRLFSQNTEHQNQ